MDADPESLAHTEELSTAQAAQMVGVQTQTLRNWRQQKKGPPAVRVRGRLRWKRADLLAWLDEEARTAAEHEARRHAS